MTTFTATFYLTANCEVEADVELTVGLYEYWDALSRPEVETREILRIRTMTDTGICIEQVDFDTCEPAVRETLERLFGRLVEEYDVSAILKEQIDDWDLHNRLQVKGY